MKYFVRRCLTLLFAAATALAAGVAQADPPTRVMRLSQADGPVSFLPAGTDDWLRISPNRPLVPGDRLWSDDGARAELRIGSSALRLDERTSVALLNNVDRMTQLQLTQGALTVRARQISRDRPIEIATPNLAYRVVRPGSVRIDVDPDGGWTEITLRSGQGDVYGEGRGFVLNAGVTYRFWGTDLRSQERYALPARDAFDRWSDERDQRWDRAASARYVSPEVVGYEDLDDHGRWQVVAELGPVWMPTAAPAGWAPYRDGHWAWVEPWGWTWIDDAPWAFAPSHYGRWTRLNERWAWVPPPRRLQPVYAPAVVQFVGGAGVSASFSIGGISAVAWFPLGPSEVYRPMYTASPHYLQQVNTTNTVIRTTNVTNIINIINAPVTNNTFVHRRAGSIVAMPVDAFAQARPVGPAALSVPRELALRLPTGVARSAPIAPQMASIAGAAPRAERRPPPAALQRPVIARAQPPAIAVPSFGTATPTSPREPAGRTAPAPRTPATAAAPAPEVRVVTARAAPLPPAPIKPTGPDRAAERRAAPAERPAATAPAPAAERRAETPPPAAPREIVPPRAPDLPVPGRTRSEQPASRPADMPPLPRQAEVKPPPRQADVTPPRQADVTPPGRAREVAPPGRQIAAPPPVKPDADAAPAERRASPATPPFARREADKPAPDRPAATPPGRQPAAAPPERPPATTPPPRQATAVPPAREDRPAPPTREAKPAPPTRESREERRADRPPAAPPPSREQRADSPPDARRAPPVAAPRKAPAASERASEARRAAFERAPKGQPNPG